MKLSVFALCLLLLICTILPGYADTLCVPLMDYDLYPIRFTYTWPMDFRPVFSSVSRVGFCLEGEMCGGIAYCDEFPWWGDGVSSLDIGISRCEYIEACMAFGQEPTDFSGMYWLDWAEDLLDGPVEAMISFGFPPLTTGAYCRMASASLIVEGEFKPVPEPSGLMCLGFALAGCVPFIRRKRR